MFLLSTLLPNARVEYQEEENPSCLLYSASTFFVVFNVVIRSHSTNIIINVINKHQDCGSVGVRSVRLLLVWCLLSTFDVVLRLGLASLF